MDASRFDALVRRIASRRSLLAGLAGGVGLVALGAEAKKKKPKPKKCKDGKKPCRGPDGRPVCVDFATDAGNCGGCGRVCDGINACLNGTCACASTPDCPGTCTCANSAASGVPACIGPGGCVAGAASCTADADCPQSSFCIQCGATKQCSDPCVTGT